MLRHLLELVGLRRQPSWAERNIVFILIIATFLFMGISLAIGLQQSVWFDEAYSVLLAKQSLGQLLHLTALDTHPPFYYLLLKLWAGLFGWSEVALRSLSVLAAGGAVIMAGLLVKRMFGAKAVLVVLPFIVFAPFLLRYGFEIRMYALASLVGVSATYVLVAAVEAKEASKQRWLYGGYAILVAVGVYTLYYTAVLWIAHLVWLAWQSRQNKQPIFKQLWLYAFVGSVLLFLPWLPTFISQTSNGALAPIAQGLTLENLMGIVSFTFLYQPSWQVSPLFALVIVFIVAALTYFGIKAFKAAKPNQKKYLLLLVFYIVVPIALVALISLVRPMYVERYLAHVVIGGNVLIGTVVYITLQKASKKVWLMAGALVVIMIVGVANLAQAGNYNFQRLQQPTIKQVAANVADDCKDKTIFAVDAYIAIELSYYLPSCHVRFYNEWPSLKGGYAPLDSRRQVKNPEQELAKEHQLVYIYYDGHHTKLPSNLQKSSETTFGVLRVARFSAG